MEEPYPERPAKKSHNEESEKTNEAIFGNLLWTKIIKIGNDQYRGNHLFSIQEDWDYFQECPPQPLKKKKKPWELVFNPVKIEKEEKDLTIEHFRLSETELLKHAKICS